MKDFWDERYNTQKYAYGILPNVFFQKTIEGHSPGKILLPGDGQGRNAVYAAKKGWEVDAFDISEVARADALNLAKSHQVHINYHTSSYLEFSIHKSYDLIALIYAHMPSQYRQSIHRKFSSALTEGGRIILEAFSKDQLNYASGGPKNVDMLFDMNALAEDFQDLKLLTLDKLEIELQEGPFHQGKADVIRLIAEKKIN